MEKKELEDLKGLNPEQLAKLKIETEKLLIKIEELIKECDEYLE